MNLLDHNETFSRENSKQNHVIIFKNAIFSFNILHELYSWTRGQ